MLINFPAMAPNMIYAALFYNPIEHGPRQNVPVEIAQGLYGPELGKTSGLPQVKPVIIDMQRCSRLVWGVHLKCVPGHCARIPVPGVLDELHVQLGVGPTWIAKSLDLLAGYL